MMDDGVDVVFSRNPDGSFTAPGNVDYTLTEAIGGLWALHTELEDKYEYDEYDIDEEYGYEFESCHPDEEKTGSPKNGGLVFLIISGFINGIFYSVLFIDKLFMIIIVVQIVVVICLQFMIYFDT